MTALYDEIGVGYSAGRRTDPRWLEPILAAVSGTVCNVGAGTGSYEPPGTVVAVEPSTAMIAQRPEGSAPVVRAVAEHLPLPSGAFDVALAVLTVHHWPDWRRGLAELRRVSARQVVLAYDAAFIDDFWLVRDYLPEVAALESTRPSAVQIASELGADRVVPLPVPWDFADGVFPAYWRRPHAYLDFGVRQACSALAQLDPAVVSRGIQALSEDLASGAWSDRYAEVLTQDTFDAGFRLIVRG